mgnify:FL=1
MYCPQCGQQVGEERGTCPICGAAIGEPVAGAGACSSCGALRAPEDTYCRQCGTLLPFDLSALEQLELAPGESLGEVPIPEWLQAEEQGTPGSELQLLSDLDLPEWLREPTESTAEAPPMPTTSAFVVPPVVLAWSQPIASETADPSLFEPLPPLLLPVAPALGGVAAAAAEPAEDRRLVRIALLLALAVLLGVVLYILWQSR